MAWWSFGESLGGLDTLGARGCGIVQRGHWIALAGASPARARREHERTSKRGVDQTGCQLSSKPSSFHVLHFPVDVRESSPDVVDGFGPRGYLDLVVIEAIDLPQLRLASWLPVDVLEV